MEQGTKKLYTTHEVARLLGVTPITVIRWIEGGKFSCFTTVGGHRRIAHDELVHFAQAYNLPWQGEEELEKRKDYVILAVDDETDVLELLQDMFSGIQGLKLITVNNGFTAGAKLVEERPDMVLLDFRMPELDGFEFCRFVREDPRFKEVIIVAVTGLKGEGEQAKMKESGANDVIHKPFTLDKLLEKIEYYRGGKNGTSGAKSA
ncbi:MAG TPA: response regulator [Verrucomicrobiae bacterium]|jgi:excisionase family DNA binding protein|nr:response regulator [Verrucomicrobiae bacterium]